MITVDLTPQLNAGALDDETFEAIFRVKKADALDLIKLVPEGYQLVIDSAHKVDILAPEAGFPAGDFVHFPSMASCGSFIAAVARPFEATFFAIGSLLPSEMDRIEPSGTGYGATSGEAVLAALRDLRSKLEAQ